jgi:hypothetical protein
VAVMTANTPPRPHRPITPYLVFAEQMRPHLLRAPSTNSRQSIGVELAKLWGKLPPSQRAIFEARARARRLDLSPSINSTIAW